MHKNLREPGAGLWLTHRDPVAYSSDSATIEINLPDDESLLITGMRYTSKAGRGETHTISEFSESQNFQINRIIGDAIPLNAIAAINGGLIAASGRGPGNRQTWHGDPLEMGDLIRTLAKRIAQRHGATAETQELRLRDGIGNLAQSGFIAGEGHSPKVKIVLSRLDSSDAIERISLRAISLGSNLGIDTALGQHGAPFWHGLVKTGITADTAAFTLKRVMNTTTGNDESLLVRALFATYLASDGSVQNNDLGRFSVNRVNEWQTPQIVWGESADLAAIASTIGEETRNDFRQSIRRNNHVGYEVAQSALSGSTGILRLAQQMTVFKPQMLRTLRAVA